MPEVVSMAAKTNALAINVQGLETGIHYVRRWHARHLGDDFLFSEPLRFARRHVRAHCQELARAIM